MLNSLSADETRLTIGLLIEATRKHLGLNQTALAPQLGLDQSALSRVESGKQNLSAAQWFVFVGITGVSADAPKYGYIELAQPESAIPLPARYSFEKHTRVRSLLPLLHYARTHLGDRDFHSFLSERKLFFEYFINLNASINFNFTLDLAEVLLKKTGMKTTDIKNITQNVGQPNMHGSLHHYYDAIFSDQHQLINAFVGCAPGYASNFKLEVLDQSETHLDLAVTPLPHMAQFQYRDHPVLNDFLAFYDKGYYENFSTYGQQKPMKVSLLENHYKGDGRCLYRMKSAAS
ncbi:helix-turn-helix transcriptional regulator [Bdellovibrionota bacterium FG-1]